MSLVPKKKIYWNNNLLNAIPLSASLLNIQIGFIKEINKKYRKIFYDMINIKDFDSNILKMDKKSYKNIDIYYIGYIVMKDSD